MRLVITLAKEVADEAEGQALLDQLLNVIASVPDIFMTAQVSNDLDTLPPG